MAKRISLIFLVLIYSLCGVAQCLSGEQIKKEISNIGNDTSLGENKKLHSLYELKKKADVCNVPRDSIYASLLSRIGFYEYENGSYGNAIALSLESVRINTLPQKNCSKIALIRSYTNLGYYYEKIFLYNLSIRCFDSTIAIAEKLHVVTDAVTEAFIERVNVIRLSGDYQKCGEESTKGMAYTLSINDTANYLDFLIQRSQALFFQNRLKESLDDVEMVPKSTNDPYRLASALKTKAMIYEKRNSYTLALTCYNQSLRLRIKSNFYPQIISDYNDLGNFYHNSIKNDREAKRSYFKAVDYAIRDNNLSKLAMVYTNLGNLNLTAHHFNVAAEYYLKTFKILNVFSGNNILGNPPAGLLNTIGNTDLITDLLSNKVLLHLCLYKKTKDEKYIAASIKTALVADSVITLKRHQQLGEQSKLYWRDQTRGFFTDAIEACYLANDAPHAFYFMEKSRSVLLNDKLNELGAAAHIPEADSKKELDLKIRIFTEQQKLNSLTINTPSYKTQEQIFLGVKQALEDFIKTLETKYPAYYNYKYSDAVPTLSSLQKRLAANNESFVHYFTNDTLAYILSITANNAKLTRLCKKDFNYGQINDFLRYCAHRELLNTNAGYRSFAELSNNIYKTLFQPLQLPKGRVIICSDNFILPFETLCTDASGKNFLINDYIFSYAYSATNLLKPFSTYPARGNFIGFAPVYFQPALHVSPLLNSAAALAKSANFYSSALLFTKSGATKNNFLDNIGRYTVANIFSHASADSTENEPKLYLQDGTVNLSELQLLNKPATRLVVLSACQTNVGKNATGEGIYSLARGFSSAGIPAIAATLWNADEDMIYEISAKFHEYLLQGMSKDEALYAAKLDYLKNNSGSEKSLPYYWANIILIGDTAPLTLTTDTTHPWWIAAAAIAILSVIIVWVKKERFTR